MPKKQVVRIDYTVKLDATFKMEKTAEGYLKGQAIVTRTGVFKYMRPDGSIKLELRHPDQVFDQASIDSFKMIPITSDHPSGLVNSDNAKKLQVGFVGENVKRVDNYLVAPIIITDGQTISDIESGNKQELSLGYTVELIEERGDYNGESFDSKQTNIRGNHLAIVYQARAGRKARLNLDSEDYAICGSNFNNNKNDNIMKKIKIDGKEYEVATEVADHIENLSKDKNAIAADLGNAKLDCTKLEGSKAALQAKLDAAEKEKLDAGKATKLDSAQISEAVKSRISLEKTANSILKSDEDFAEISDRDLMVKAITKLSPEFKADGKDDIHVKAFFEAFTEANKSLNVASQHADTKENKDSKDSDAEASRSDEDLSNDLVKRSLEAANKTKGE